MTFADEIAASLPPTMVLPRTFAVTFDWLEASGYVSVASSGERIGAFHPAFDPCLVWVHAEEGRRHLASWTGNADPRIVERLAVIFTTGGDGSKAAIWLDDGGHQRFVHMGSGSGSVLTCVLADDPLDMLRLLAIGYPELCWNEEFGRTPDEVRDDQAYANGEDSFSSPDHEPFRRFLIETFDVAIPKTADEIVKVTASMDDPLSDDPFCMWVRAIRR